MDAIGAMREAVVAIVELDGRLVVTDSLRDVCSLAEALDGVGRVTALLREGGETLEAFYLLLRVGRFTDASLEHPTQKDLIAERDGHALHETELPFAEIRIRETATEFGEQRIYASHSSIMFSRTSCYFFVRPKRSFLEVCIFLGRSVKAPQIRRVNRASKSKMVHMLRITHRDQVEAPITDWLREAYELSDVLAAASRAKPQQTTKKQTVRRRTAKRTVQKRAVSQRKRSR